MQLSMVQKIRGFVLFGLAVLLALFLAYLSLYMLDAVTLLRRPIFAENASEIFTRIFLVWTIFLIAAYIVLKRDTRQAFFTQRWLSIMAILFLLGAAFALGDPLHPVRAEFNFIRYWTSGALAVGGIICILGALNSAYPALDRFFGIFFCILLFAASGDEVLQFHEIKGRELTGSLPEDAILHGSDTVTLSVAVLGALVVVLAILFTRYVPWAKRKMTELKYRRTFSLLTLGVVVLLTAMLLDSFDFILEDNANQLRASIFGITDAANAPLWLGDGFIMAASNAIEELFEFAAALCFLMAVATLFSVRILGCDSSSRPVSGATSAPA